MALLPGYSAGPGSALAQQTTDNAINHLRDSCTCNNSTASAQQSVKVVSRTVAVPGKDVIIKWQGTDIGDGVLEHLQEQAAQDGSATGRAYKHRVWRAGTLTGIEGTLRDCLQPA